MKIVAARYEGGELILSTTDPEARRVAYKFKAGEYELVRRKPRRSLDANAYAWALIDKLAAATGLSKTEVYREAIRDIGGVSEVVCVLDRAAGKLCRGWEHNGLGWQAETEPSKIPGYTNVVLHYGSSVYDTQQMSRLIDHLIQDAKALDIETLPPWQLEGLLSQWEEAAARKPSV